MFAIIKTGGKQYKVAKDEVIIVEKLDGEVGSTYSFDEVLMVDDNIGSPLVKGAKVTGEIMAQKKDDKVLVFKKRRRQNYRRLKGHRQQISIVKIKDIVAG
ncbi:MAG: 50S ribosomal protein L21 [Alphaproteobacteria bacterium]|nr:50S ribosomal protein L21 [Alphaproteobacteria bacterium]